MIAEACHALRVRLSRTADPAGVAERLSGRLAALAGARLWVDDVPGPAAGRLAVRRRATELARPAGAAPRSVLLRYTDGLADLILVGPREIRLRRLAAAALSSADGPTEPIYRPPVAGSSQPAPVQVEAAAPSWGLGSGSGSATLQFELPLGFDLADLADQADQARWRRALTVALARYSGPDGEQTPSVGLLTDPELERPLIAGPEFADPEVTSPAIAGAEYVPCLAPVFGLTLSFGQQPGGPQLRCDFRLSQFSPAIVKQFAEHLIHLYQQIFDQPETPNTELDLLCPAELERVVQLGRPTRTWPGASQSTMLPEAISAVAATQPDAVAIRDREVTLTYRDLDERSDQRAAGLRALGVKPGDRVGICLERDAELVVTMLGVLKTGAAYVPMDPAYPNARLAHTTQDAGLWVVVTRLPDFPATDGVHPVPPEALTSFEPTPTISPSRPVSPDDSAYVIYTSGSTGRPKGVAVPHRNVISLLAATRDGFGLRPDDVWTLFHSSAFDFSVWEIWGCLLTGGRLVVVPYSVSREPDQFADLLRSERVTVLSQTPSAFAQLIAVDPAELALRLVIFGGEPLDTRMLLPWFDRHPETECRLVNMFGITETTVHVTAQTVTRADALAASRSVGTAIPGWWLYVLDPAGRLLPPGVAGEIYVGGAGVASEYLNQPELTGQRFLPDPFAGGRMYRSGDRGRLLPDGRLEHLGRVDSQVKLRGFRIELDEIRAVLLEDSRVRAAAVVVHTADPADPATARLDAYVVLSGPRSTLDLSSGVRRRAAELLPEHMIPATVTVLDALPLTTNGKLDAANLPLPAGAVTPLRPRQTDAASQSSASQSSASQAAVEGALPTMIQVWTEVLGRPVGPDDDFFELGGNSLLAVRISAAVRARGLPALRLRDLYRHATIRAIIAAQIS